MGIKTTVALSVLVASGFHKTANAVVANQDLPVNSAPPSICYIEMWNQDVADPMTASPTSACTGTLIRTNRVLTAGHCVPGLKAATRTVVTCNNGSQMFGMKAVEADPQYGGENDDPDQDLHDVALIDLQSPEKPGSRKYITPMILAGSEAEITSALANPSQCALWGYGRNDLSTTDQSWGTLRGALIDYLNPAAWTALGESEMMEREIYIGPSVHAGPGDSGGPIVCPSADGSSVFQIATTMIEGQITAGTNAGFYYSAHEKISFNLDWINATADLPNLPSN